MNDAAIDGDIYVLAAFGKKTHWYRNILAAPETAIAHQPLIGSDVLIVPQVRPGRPRLRRW